MSGLKKQPALVASSEAAAWLSKLSKAALIDLLCDRMAIHRGAADDPVPLVIVKVAAGPVLRARGDRVPK